MSTPDNEQVVRRFIEEVVNQGNLNTLDEVYDTTYMEQGKGAFAQLGLPGGPDRAGAKEGIAALRKAIPDLQMSIQNVKAMGDQVTFEWSARGTQRGHILDLSPTGKGAQVHGTATVRLAQGKIVAFEAQFDPEDIKRQLQGKSSPR